MKSVVSFVLIEFHEDDYLQAILNKQKFEFFEKFLPVDLLEELFYVGRENFQFFWKICIRF